MWEPPWPEQACGPVDMSMAVGMVDAMWKTRVELTRNAHVVYFALGLSVAGLGLLVAAVLQLFVILPSLVVRRSLVRFARGVVRRSFQIKRQPPRPWLLPS